MFCEICLCTGYHLSSCPEKPYEDITDGDIEDIADIEYERQIEEKYNKKRY